MSGGFGLPVLNLQDAIGKVGTAYTDAYDKSVQQGALAALGTQLQAGNYAGAAKTAFDAGDAATGLSLIKLGQSAAQAQQASAAFGGLAGLYGGGAGGDASQGGAGAPGTSRGSGQVPSFLDLGSGPSGSYVASLFKRESGNNTMAQAPTSSARGLGQFTRDTWNRVAKQNPGLNLTPVTRSSDGRTDPEQMLRATQALTSENEGLLQNSGLPVNDATRYALHFLGGGGRRLVAGAMQNPDAPAASFADPKAVAANRNVFFNRDGSPKSAGEVMGDFGRSFGGGGRAAPAAQAAPAPVRVVSADPDALTLPRGASGLNPAVAAASPAAPPFVAIPGGGAPAPAPAAPDDAVPTLAQPALTRTPMQIPGAAPAQQAEDGEDPNSTAVTPPTVTPPTVQAPNRQQISAQAPQHLEQAGLPPAAAVAVGNTAPGSQNRVGVLMRIAGMPGLNEGQSKVVGALLANELDQTKLPESVKQYLFAKSPAGGGFDGSFADFQNKKGDEGAKIQAQLAAREQYAIAHGMDPKDAGVQAWIMGGKTTTGHVLKPGDILAGPNGKTLAQNAATASSMSDDTANFLAERVLAGDTRALIGLGRGAQGAENLSKIQGIVAQKAREQGLDPTDIQQRAAEAAGLGAQARTLGTQAGRMTAAATEAEGAIALARQASAAVPRTSFVPLNRLSQAVQSNTGDPSLRAFNAANNTLINTFARAVSPTGVGTVADKEHARELLSTADSPQAYEAVLQQMQAEIDMAHKAPQRARTILENERQAAKSGGTPAPATVPNPMQPSGAGQPQRPAQAAPQYRDGQTATGPGGQKVIFSRGQWVPLQAAPTTTASPQAGGTL